MQNGGMPQFGAQNNNQANQSGNGLASSQAQVGQAQNGQVQPEQQAVFGSVAPVPEKSKTFTSLKKEQIMPALVAIFGFLTLIFLVSTIALAASKPSSNSGTKQSTSTVTASATAELMRFSPSKIINPTADATYRLGTIVKNADGHQVITAFADEKTNNVIFEVNWEFVKDYYNVNSTRVDQETFRITTGEPEIEVADILIGRAGSDRMDDVLLILMTDGTIEYMPIRSSLEKYAFRMIGKIADAENIVKFYNVYETVKGELTETLVAQKANGEIVDLRSQLLKIVGKDTKPVNQQTSE